MHRVCNESSSSNELNYVCKIGGSIYDHKKSSPVCQSFHLYRCRSMRVL